MVERIYPILIGDYDEESLEYSNYFSSNCLPNAADIISEEVEKKLIVILSNLGLGLPLLENMTVKNVLAQILKNQGGKIVGRESLHVLLERQVDVVAKMISDCSLTHDAGNSDGRGNVVLEGSNKMEQMRLLKNRLEAIQVEKAYLVKMIHDLEAVQARETTEDSSEGMYEILQQLNNLL